MSCFEAEEQFTRKTWKEALQAKNIQHLKTNHIFNKKTKYRLILNDLITAAQNIKYATRWDVRPLLKTTALHPSTRVYNYCRIII